MRKVCIVGASGKLGQYMVQHALDRGYEVVGVCRDASVEKLDAFKERITIIPGAPTTARSSSAPSPAATAFSLCLPRWASTSTRQEQRKLFSTTHVRGRASCSRAGGTL